LTYKQASSILSFIDSRKGTLFLEKRLVVHLIPFQAAFSRLRRVLERRMASILPGHIHVRPNRFIRSQALCVALHSVNDKGDRIIMRHLHIPLSEAMTILHMKAHEKMEEATHFTVRIVQIQDVPFLWDMLYEAAAVAESMRTLGKEKALSLPVNRKYVEGWGRLGDAGVIAVDQAERPLGAAWYRLHPNEAPGYGFVSPTIPELTIGVRADARGQGIGRALLQALIALAQSQRYAALSLSVDRNNPALHLYERFGFRDAGISDQEETSVTMIKQWSEEC